MTRKSLKPSQASSQNNKNLPCGRPSPKTLKTRQDATALLKDMIRKLDAFVAEKNLNRSEARARILDVIASEGAHFRAQDLIEKIHGRFPGIGRSTVYRNLPIFVECGLIQEGPTDPDGEALYELSDSDHHDHIVCTDCGAIIEFHDAAIEARQDAVSSKLGFAVKGHRHVIYGACEYLRKKDRSCDA